MKKLGGVTKGTLSNIGFDKQNNLSKEILLFLYFLATIIIFAVLLLRLFQLTIVKGNYYHTLADNNRTKELILEAKRGKIIDRKGLVIAQNLDINIDLNQERIVSKREYFYPQAIAHLIGYRQLADSQDLKDDNCLTKLRVGDKIGKKGIEKLFDCELRGKAGKKLIELTARGEYKKTLSIIPPQPGQTLQLAIDLELQTKTYELIKDQKAAVVAVRPTMAKSFYLFLHPVLILRILRILTLNK
jgi:penicillin-binding protein 2